MTGVMWGWNVGCVNFEGGCIVPMIEHNQAEIK